MKMIDHTGRRYGRLLVQHRIESHNKHVRWLCACDCGRESQVTSTHLTSGHSTSCGCARNEHTAARNRAITKHGMWRTPEFSVWSKMLGRCYNQRHKSYANYGGRGITVCKEWRESFSAFYADVGPRPSAAHSIDRVRNDEGYYPGNVRWATATEQNNNRRSNVTADIGGVRMTAAQIARAHKLHIRTVLYRIHCGMSEERITAPSRRASAARL